MIKVITTVGTSLFTNYRRKEVQKYWENEANINPQINNYNVETDYKNLLKENLQYTSRSESAIKTAIENYWLKDILTNIDINGDLQCIKAKGLNHQCCAEVQTLLAIAQHKDYKDKDLEVHLLCTDTTLSRLAAEIIAGIDFNPIAKIKFADYSDDKKYFAVDSLQVKDAKKFEDTGFLKLVEQVKSIKGGNNDVILNISGGYKALIPPLTLLAQLEEIPLYYIYEDSGELIETGNLPINFDWGVIEQYTAYLHNQSKRNKADADIIDEMRKLKLVRPDSNELSIIGKLIAEYSKQASPFTQTIFGYLVEYKLDEYYAAVYGREKVQHGVKFGEMKGSEDIDIFIKPAENKFITMEVKHAGFVLDNEEQMKKITKNLIHRATQAKNSGQGEIQEIWLMLYSYSNDKNPSFELTESQKRTLEEVNNAIKEDEVCKNAPFKAKHFYINSNELRDESHIYQTFIKSTLKEQKIIGIYDSQ
ncbi:MAG: hypothetical protein IPM47_14115 [Sphingobacteriales bacterium]|nr:MAG: hypothetical protein IPM47_14115 [Sphingobacteriales bacterium]